MTTNFAGSRAALALGARLDAAPVTTDPLIRDADGAFMMGCSKATFWRRVADGTVPPAIKIGGMSRWRLSDIEAVISKAEAEREQTAA
ncbi:helix-turn-helix transcriptional regulator [Pseudooceanicola sp.]|uniref:helix-turn-helix transcriptional regulator n=1 Tax=Pseudooceanicola sp. TaxID=1914328 RepID=UPI003516120E